MFIYKVSQKALANMTKFTVKKPQIMDSLNGTWLGSLDGVKEFRIVNHIYRIDKINLIGIGHFWLEGCDSLIIFKLRGVFLAVDKIRIEYRGCSPEDHIEGREVLQFSEDKNTLFGRYFGTGRGKKHSGEIHLQKEVSFSAYNMT